MCKRRDLTICVAVFFFLLWALFTHSHVNSWNDASRLATVEALVHQGTWAIENTVFFSRTADYILWNGHFYSDKPPVLPFLTASLYTVLHKGLQISFDASARCDPVSNPCYCFAVLCPQAVDWVYYLVTLTFVGLPSALMLALFYRSTDFFSLPNSLALLLTGALGLATMVWPYSLVFNNHVLTAAGLLAGFYALLRARVGKGSPERWLVIAGFATALAFTFDLLVVPFLAAFLIAALLRHRLRAWAFVAGCLVPLLLLVALDFWYLGDPLPPSMHPAGFDYPGSPFAATPTGNPPSADVLSHGLQMLFGDRGLFTLNPVMILAAVGLGVLLCKRSHWLWGEAVAATLAGAAATFSLIVYTPGFGGICYGTRWFMDIVPLLFLFAAWPGLYRVWIWRSVAAVLVVLSLLSAWQGALNPWGVTLPPYRLLQYAFSPAGRYLGSLPSGTFAYTTLADFDTLPIYPVHAWHTRLRKFDPAQGALPLGDPGQDAVYVLSADAQVTEELVEMAFPNGQWDLRTERIAIYRVPASADRARPGQSAQAEFGGLIRLLGSDPLPDALRPGDTVRAQLYWQALAPIGERYTAFVHLLGPTNQSTGNPLWAQDDHQPGHETYPTDFWLPGEIVLDAFQFTIPGDAPAGEYTLTTGFYKLETLQRLGRSDGQGDTVMLSRTTVTP
jgi:hypothetical protein